MSPKHNGVVIVPCFNHQATLNDVVEGVLAEGYSVIVVDDGSTVPISKKQFPVLSDPKVTLIKHKKNLGKGRAIITGLTMAKKQGYTRAVTIDADGQHDPKNIHLLFDKAENYEQPVIIIGAREGMDRPEVPASSRFGMHFSNFWVYLETGISLPDTQSGFRLYPVKETLELALKCKRYDFEIEVLVKAVWAGIAVDYVYISCNYAPQGKRISHFNKFFDNLRLSLLHAKLVTLRLFPLHQIKKLDTAILKEWNEQNIVSSCYNVFRHPIKLIRQISTQHSSPSLLAAAVWTGLFLGTLPLIACHTIVILYVAHRCHLNKVAAVGASQFCCPPVVPVLSIEAGHFLLYGSFLTNISIKQLTLELHLRLFEWLVGSLVVGPVLGLIGGTIVYITAKRLNNFLE